jgi:enolase-phosphatase E1
MSGQFILAGMVRPILRTSMPPSTSKAILLDIEGTTTPISFVHDVLFPYSRKHLKSYLAQHANSIEVLADLAALREEHATDVTKGKKPPPRVEEYLYWLIDQDRKSPALKSLQGKIWKQGYDDGSLRAPVFADVPPAMERWVRAGKSVNIFSSGSVLAQKMLFAKTEAGDLTKFISNYFDTEVGKKTDVKSYEQIAKTLSLASNEIHFLSDVLTELDAAAGAGMKTALCIRPGNPAQEFSSRHNVIHSFDEIMI